MDAPVQAPKWTLGGYRGSLKAAIQEAIKSIPRRVEQQQQQQQRHQRHQRPQQEESDEPPQDEPADETQTPAPAPQVTTSDEPQSISLIISSQMSTDEPGWQHNLHFRRPHNHRPTSCPKISEAACHPQKK